MFTVTVTVTITGECKMSLEERGEWFTGESQGEQVGESGGEVQVQVRGMNVVDGVGVA